MKLLKISFLLIILFLSYSCQKEYNIESIEIGEQSHIVGNHYNSQIKLCFTENLGYSSFGLTLNIETNNGRKFKCSKQIPVHRASSFKPDDKCIQFSTRPMFNKRDATEEDYVNMKSLRLNNIKTLSVKVWNNSFKEQLAEREFKNL